MRKTKGEAGVEMLQKKSCGAVGDPGERQGTGGRMVSRKMG